MLLFILIGGAALAIVVGGIRIVIGWVLPAEMTRAIDRAFNFIFTTFFKIVVVALAGLIIWFGYLVATS